MLEPASGANEPAGHVMQDWLFEEGLEEPAGQSEHTARLLPNFTRAVPGLQAKAEQLDDPSDEKESVAQGKHVETPSAGALTEKVLAGQGVHCELAASEYAPRGQNMQVEAPAVGAMDPAEHALQELDPNPLMNPGGHCMQELESIDPTVGL